MEGGGREDGGGVASEDVGAEVDAADTAPVVLVPLVAEVGGCVDCCCEDCCGCCCCLCDCW